MRAVFNDSDPLKLPKRRRKATVCAILKEMLRGDPAVSAPGGPNASAQPHRFPAAPAQPEGPADLLLPQSDCVDYHFGWLTN
jgi:hypothetical protein